MTDLTKWPRLIVTGKNVTPEQANDILIRTNVSYLGANDKAWVAQIAAEFGVPLGPYGDPDWRALREVYRHLGWLDLHYLHNERIVSSWIGGPHGWCDWDGRIGCSTHNIGKWPTREEVQDDLDQIAAAWPYLTMDVQLIADEGEGNVLAMWQVREGTALFVEPGDRLPIEELSEGDILARLTGLSGERGVSIQRLRQAIAQVAAASS